MGPAAAGAASSSRAAASTTAAARRRQQRGCAQRLMPMNLEVEEVQRGGGELRRSEGGRDAARRGQVAGLQQYNARSNISAAGSRLVTKRMEPRVSELSPHRCMGPAGSRPARCRLALGVLVAWAQRAKLARHERMSKIRHPLEAEASTGPALSNPRPAACLARHHHLHGAACAQFRVGMQGYRTPERKCLAALVIATAAWL